MLKMLDIIVIILAIDLILDASWFVFIEEAEVIKLSAIYSSINAIINNAREAIGNDAKKAIIERPTVIKENNAKSLKAKADNATFLMTRIIKNSENVKYTEACSTTLNIWDIIAVLSFKFSGNLRVEA